MPNGTDKTASALGLPSTVTIATEDISVTTANVGWDLTTLASGSYDKSVLTEQIFTVNGSVELPAVIDADGKSLATSISVTVKAAAAVSNVTSNLVEGNYTSNQSVELSSTTDGADIYYTMDGTTPSKMNGTKYTGAIEVIGIAGSEMTRIINAVAVKDGMQDSEVTSFVYKITIPSASPLASPLAKPTASPSATPMTEEQTTADVAKQKLGMKVTSSTNQVKISWIKVPGADGYYIYGAKCGNKPKKLKTIKKASTTTWTQKNLKKGKVYKYTIVAYKNTTKGTQKLFSSPQFHITTKGGKYTNAKKVKTTFSSVTLTQGKTKQIKASIIKQIKKKKLVNHASTYRYLISDKRIVRVTKNG